MKILITGANGYIGLRLIAFLLEQKHELYCCVRQRKRFGADHLHRRIHIIEIDFLHPVEDQSFPKDIDVAFYLIHSLNHKGPFSENEAIAARNFVHLIEETSCRQVVYLGAIVNEENLSKHLSSRFNVEKILNSGRAPVTVLRAGIIVGSGSASFEIIRDMVEKVPVMVVPRWLDTLCQPVSVRNVMQFLTGVMLREDTYGKDFDIGGPEILSYKQMLLQFAEVRGLKRYIYTLPILTPKISAYWLFFISSTPYRLTANLVESLKVHVVCRNNSLAQDLGIELIPYQAAVKEAFRRIEQNSVISSWRDAFSSFDTTPELMEHVAVPTYGCNKDFKKRDVTGKVEQVLDKVWNIGGRTGWYYADFLWKTRGYIDRIGGGVGLRRGRTNADKINAGDSLDFWRVLIADREGGRLLLFSEMRMPGEGWLEFKIVRKGDRQELHQTATYRPIGLKGRLYWLSMLPMHYFIFNGMINNLVKVDEELKKPDERKREKSPLAKG